MALPKANLSLRPKITARKDTLLIIRPETPVRGSPTPLILGRNPSIVRETSPVPRPLKRPALPPPTGSESATATAGRTHPAMALDAATFGFLQTVAIALIVGVLFFLLFSVLRTKFDHVYQFRRLIHQWKDHDDFNGNRVGIPKVFPRKSPFAWISAALAADDEELNEQIGLDMTMYLRYLRSMMIAFAIVAVIGVALLMPVYGTGSNKNIVAPSPSPSPPPGASPGAEANEIVPVRGLKVVSMANVPKGDPRMWATIIMEIIATCVFLWFMYHDYRRYAELRRKNLCSENPKNYAIAVYDIPKEHINEADIKKRFETIVPGQVAKVIIVRQNKKPFKLHKQLDAAVAKREQCEWVQANKGGDAPQHRPGCFKSKVDSIDHWTSEQNRLEDEIIDGGRQAIYSSSAIIVFKNKRAASLLMQANIAADATEWNVEKMPEPKAIHWGAFSVPGYQAEIRRVAVLIAVIALTLFWTIPAMGIASLINLKALARDVVFLKPILSLPDALLGLIQGLLPVVILAVIISLIPVFIRLMVKLEREHDEHVIDRKTRDYFYGFTIYGSFFIIVIGASILEQMTEIINDPISIFSVLGQKIPGNGLFFATFIAIQTGITVSMDLFNPVRLILVWLFGKLAKTERAKRKAAHNGCNPILFKRYGNAMMIAFMGIVFTPLAPIVTVCALVYFAYNYLVSRYNMQYNLWAESDGAGESYPGAFWGTLIGLLLHQIVVIVLVASNEGAAMAPFAIIPCIITVVFGIETGRRFRRVSMFGSLHDHFSESVRKDEIPKNYVKEYTQPAIKPEKYNNLNGVEENLDDYHERRRGIASDDDGLKSDDEDPDIEAKDV